MFAKILLKLSTKEGISNINNTNNSTNITNNVMSIASQRQLKSGFIFFNCVSNSFIIGLRIYAMTQPITTEENKE
jgi:hypothetical protein